jgi:hypothetical protein
MNHSPVLVAWPAAPRIARPPISVHMSGVGGTSGIALVDVYELR